MDVVHGSKLMKEGSEGFIYKMGSSITYYHPWCPILGEHHLVEHPSCTLRVGYSVG
jgi:hypothetical protein